MAEPSDTPRKVPSGPLSAVTDGDISGAKNVTVNAKGGVVAKDESNYYAPGLDPEDVTDGNGHG